MTDYVVNINLKMFVSGIDLGDARHRARQWIEDRLQEFSESHAGLPTPVYDVRPAAQMRVEEFVDKARE